MRALVCIVGIGLVCFAAPAFAQTYDPSYPVCMQVIAFNINYPDCRYVTMEQCKASASGRAGYCFANPYFANPYVGKRSRPRGR
jgi:Protein of unknown function (DUF3551)